MLVSESVPYSETPIYQPPAVVYEAPLEVRAGSPLSLPLDDPLKM